MGALESMAAGPAVLPPTLVAAVGETLTIEAVGVAADDGVPQAIAGFVCAIEYADVDGVVSERAISCRRLEDRGGDRLIGAICLRSRRYKLFRCDRVLEVTDIITGESLGNAAFFDQFAVGRFRERVDTWNTTPSRKALIVYGLNVLAFMARCDGHWHALEGEVVEDFVCSLWIRKEWEGEPPLDRIVNHAKRLAPDGQVFETAIRQFAHSRTSREVLTRFVHRLIAADGVICDAEHMWAERFDECMAEAVTEAIARRGGGAADLYAI